METPDEAVTLREIPNYAQCGGEGAVLELGLPDGATWRARPTQFGVSIEEGYILIPWSWIKGVMPLQD